MDIYILRFVFCEQLFMWLLNFLYNKSLLSSYCGLLTFGCSKIKMLRNWICDFFECSAGTFSNSLGSKKHSSSKIVVVILLICVICTTIAFLASVLCFVFRRDRCPIQSPIFSSDKDTSSGSTANLISHRTGTSSVPETKLFVNSPNCHITGKLSFYSMLHSSNFLGFLFSFQFVQLYMQTPKFC